MKKEHYWYLGASCLAVAVAAAYAGQWVVAAAAVVVGVILVLQGNAAAGR